MFPAFSIARDRQKSCRSSRVDIRAVRFPFKNRLLLVRNGMLVRKHQIGHTICWESVSPTVFEYAVIPAPTLLLASSAKIIKYFLDACFSDVYSDAHAIHRFGYQDAWKLTKGNFAPSQLITMLQSSSAGLVHVLVNPFIVALESNKNARRSLQETYSLNVTLPNITTGDEQDRRTP